MFCNIGMLSSLLCRYLSLLCLLIANSIIGDMLVSSDTDDELHCGFIILPMMTFYDYILLFILHSLNNIVMLMAYKWSIMDWCQWDSVMMWLNRRVAWLVGRYVKGIGLLLWCDRLMNICICRSTALCSIYVIIYEIFIIRVLSVVKCPCSPWILWHFNHIRL